MDSGEKYQGQADIGERNETNGLMCDSARRPSDQRIMQLERRSCMLRPAASRSGRLGLCATLHELSQYGECHEHSAPKGDDTLAVPNIDRAARNLGNHSPSYARDHQRLNSPVV